ncbi:MFS general substrate transporter [Xylariaceae sp. FL1019]|nr:MFS general substrate transporter [Xylariaceae sp. FL1019]
MASQERELKEANAVGFPTEDTLDPDQGSEADEYPKGVTLVVLTGAVVLSVFLISLDQTIIGTAIPKITGEFQGLADVPWYASAYFMTYGGFQSSWGKTYKYFSLKMTFITAVVIFEIGSIVCGAAPNANALIVGRAIAGVGGAGMSTGGTTIIAFSAAPANRPVLLGIVGVTYALAAVVGPLLGGVFSDRVTWRWCFYINAPIVKPVQAGWKEKLLQMNPIDVILLMSTIINFLLALQWGGQAYPWNNSVVIGLLVGFVVIGLALVLWETYQAEYAMLTPRITRQRSTWAPSIFQFFFAGCYFLLLYYLPIYFQSVRGASPIQSGVDNLPLIVAAGLFALLGGITVSKTGHAVPFMVLGSAVTTVSIGLLYTLGINTPTADYIGYQILFGVVASFPFQNGINVIQARVDKTDIASATSILYCFQVLGGAFSVAAAQSAFLNRLIANLAYTAPGVDPQLVVSVGATQLRSTFPADQVPGVILAYSLGIKAAFAVGVGMAGAAFLFTDFARFHEWSQGSIKSVEAASPNGTLNVGDDLRLTFPGMGTWKAKVTMNSGSEFRWANRFPGLSSEHAFRFEDSKVTQGHTTFVNAEEFGGAITSIVTFFGAGKHDGPSPGFVMFNQSLKERAESIPPRE